MIERALIALLLADTSTAALVGTRIYPHRVPQRKSQTSSSDAGAFPHIWMQRISTKRVKTQDGYTGLVYARVQINCDGLTASSAKAVCEAVRLAQNGFGQMLDGWKQATMASLTFVQSCWLEEDGDGYTADVFAGDVGVSRCSIDASVWFEESVI